MRSAVTDVGTPGTDVGTPATGAPLTPTTGEPPSAATGAPPSAATSELPVAHIILAEADWRAREAAHQQRADEFSRGWRERQGTGAKHPVDDFLFTYYPIRPSILRRWHPGAGVGLEAAGDDERAQWKWYRTDVPAPAGRAVAAPARHASVAPARHASVAPAADPGAEPAGCDGAAPAGHACTVPAGRTGTVSVDAAGFAAAHEGSIRFIVSLLGATAARPAQLSCFGLHEWAMVYRAGAAEASPHRHDVPLRLGQSATDAVVEENRITCTHFDAFRFFTPEAVPLNRLVQPTRANQLQTEQPGCLHAGMDVYKWATKLGPLIPGELLLDCFELARDIRELDMRAAPYDLADWGYEPVQIELAEGRAEYARQQRGFAERSTALRHRLIAAATVGHEAGSPVLSGGL